MDAEGIRQQAQDENTAPEILAELANSKDYLTRQYVASNPNTPIEVLEKIGQEFPEAITANPIFDLLLLENPESKFLQLCLARSSTTPIATLEKLIEKEDIEILCAIANNSNASDSILEKLALFKSQDSRKDWSREGVRCNVASNPNLPIFIIEILAKDRSEYVRHIIALNTKIPIETLNNLAKDTSLMVRKSVVKNLKTPVKIIEELAKDDIFALREELVSNPITPLPIIQEIAVKNRLPVPLRVLLANRTKFPCILEFLAQDPRVKVRRAVAGNLHTPTSVLEQLLKDNYLHTHLALLNNCNSSDALKEIIKFVLYREKVSYELLAKLGNSEHLYIRKTVARNLLTPKQTLLRLAEEKSVRIKKSLLFRNNLDSEIIDKILTTTIEHISAKSKSFKLAKERYILCLIAKNPYTSQNTLNRLTIISNSENIKNVLIHKDPIKATIDNR